jgi:puromycin-sensitive aminopeptidase
LRRRSAQPASPFVSAHFLFSGFASWAENWAVDKIHPDYAMWDQFTTGHFSSALRLDALRSSHPIEVPIKHAEEVEQVFDAISYCKGATVVRMIKAVLGMKNFQTGLVSYMKEHAYGNTETSDLWRAWESSSGMPVRELMASWTEQMGFPLLRVVKEDWQADKVTLELEQSWFLSDGKSLDEAGSKKLWTIPILTSSSEGMQEDMTLMREKSCTVTIPSKGWVKLNADQQVPMRVQPGQGMLERLSSGIREKTLGPIDRAGLLNDSYALVKSGHMSPEALIKLLVNYKEEDNYIVWEALSQVLGGLDAVLSDNEGMSLNLKKFAKGFALKLLGKVGWEAKSSDGHLTTLLRGIMVDQLCSYAFDDPDVAKEAKGRFQAFQEDHNDVKMLPSDMRVQVFSICLKNGGQKEYDDVKSYFYSATDNAERKHVLSSLGNTPDAKLKLATMDWTTSGDVKLQDMFYAMGSVGRSSREGREISWKYFQDNFDRIRGMLETASPSLMGATIVMCAGAFCSNDKADEIEAFFAAHPLPQCTLKISQTVEAMRTNAKFLAALEASPLSQAQFWELL